MKKELLIIGLVLILLVISGCSNNSEKEKISQCERGGGEWKELGDTSVDFCGSVGGGDAITLGCDCGTDSCWDSKKCILNSDFEQKKILEEELILCNVDSDCVPASCCHSESVVNKKYAPNCDVIDCTASCEGPLDCGVGKPVCIDNKCQIESFCKNDGMCNYICEEGVDQDCTDNTLPKDVKEMCANSAGEWKTLTNTCADFCYFERYGELCGEALTDGCDCGPDMCWNGEACENN